MTLKVKKPIKAWNKVVKFKFSKLFKSMTKSVVSFWGLTPYHGLKDLIESLRAISLEDDLSGSAYRLILISIINSVYELLEENKDLLHHDLNELNKIYDSKDFIALLDRLENILEKSETTISESWFKSPTSIDVFGLFKTEYENWLLMFGLTTLQVDLIIDRLDSYFIWNLNNEWRSNYEAYNLIFQHLKTPFTNATKREIDWSTYESYLYKQIEEPVFEEVFSIKQVFIPPRGYVTTENKERIEKIGEHEYFEKELIVHDVFPFLKSWVEKPDHPLKIISGGPGSGKSTLTKMFSNELGSKRAAHILYIPLQHYNINKSLSESISELIRFEGILDFNPLEEIHSLTKKLVLVFDGLDELSKQGTLAKEVAKEFVNEVNRTLSIVNSSEIKLLCIITGRILSIQDQFSIRKSANNIINLLPYFVPKEDRESYVDKSNLLKDDHRKIWWKKYTKVKHGKSRAYPKNLQNASLIEITSQPLLNYLVALSYDRKKINFSKKTNLNEIYEDLIRSVFNRKYEKERHSALNELDISEENFIRILEEIAVSAWQNGEVRITTVQKINEHIKANKLSSLFKEFQKGAQAGITRLLTAFYFRQKGLDNLQHKTFEFTHKSFGEYLIARRLVRVLKLCLSRINEHKLDPDSGWDIPETLKRFIEITGQNTIDNYIYEFLKNEFKLLEKKHCIEYQDILVEMIQYVLNSAMPVELINPRLNSHLLERETANKAEENLFCLLHLSGTFSDKRIKIEWPDETSLGNLISRLNQSKKVGIRTYLSNMVIENQELSSRGLTMANFANSILRKVVFSGADLWGADFTNSIIENCNFYRASIHFAILHSTKLVYPKDYDSPSLTIGQLLSCKSLYNLKGLNEGVKSKILDINKDAFKKTQVPMDAIIKDHYINKYQ